MRLIFKNEEKEIDSLRETLSRFKENYWFSEFPCLRPFIDYVSGTNKGQIHVVRQEARKLFLEHVGTSRQFLETTILENQKLKGRIKYLESLAKEGLKEVS